MRIVVIVLALALIIYSLAAAIAPLRIRKIDSVILNPDFETGDLKGWTKTGNAFDNQPTFGDNPKARNREGSNHQGNWWIGGFEKYQGRPGQKPGDIQSDKPTGTLTSSSFTLRGDQISFLLGGGNHPWVEPDGTGSTCVNLLVNGRFVRTATGSNDETMKRYLWDVSKLKGKTVVVQLVDKNSGGWGHINFDDLRQITRWETEKGNFILYLWAGATLLLIALEKRE